MPTNWTKIVTDGGVGVGVGAVSGVAERYDENRGETEFLKKAGNYIDYGLPILAILGSLGGFLKGDWETRAITLGGSLAARRVTREYIYKPAPAGKWAPYEPPPGGGPPPTTSSAQVGLEF